MEQNKEQQQGHPGTQENKEQQQQEQTTPQPAANPRKDEFIEEERDLDEEAHRQLEREG